MVNICIEQLENLDFIIVSTTIHLCLRIRIRHNAFCASIVLEQEPLKYVNELRYLGFFC